MFQYKLPNGQYMIPSDDGNVPTPTIPDNAYVPGTAVFSAHQLVTNLDWNRTPSDIISVKYYFQDDPTVAPYAYSMVAGFTQRSDCRQPGDFALQHSNARPEFQHHRNLGFARQNIYSSVGQPFTPQQMGINTFGSTRFPGLSIVDILGNSSPNNVNYVADASLNIGQGSASQGAFTGVTQNRMMPSVECHVEQGQAHGELSEAAFPTPNSIRWITGPETGSSLPPTSGSFCKAF